jgi:hypothetical protein
VAIRRCGDGCAEGIFRRTVVGDEYNLERGQVVALGRAVREAFYALAAEAIAADARCVAIVALELRGRYGGGGAGLMAIPELTQHQRDLMAMGLCPFCERQIRGWEAPVGSFAPEARATLRDHGVDPRTGHRADCPHKDVRL